MQEIDLLVCPEWLIPIEPAGQVLEQHAMAVDQGRILELLPKDFAQQRYQPKQTLELPGHAVCPGLINAHTHSAMSLMRGLADDLPLMTWLQEHIWPAEGQHVSADFCATGVELACAEMIRSGTTCFNDMYFFGDQTARVATRLGLRAGIGLIVMDFPTIWAQDADEYLHKAVELHDSLRDESLIHCSFAPHAPYTVSDAPLRKLRALADELELPIHMHVHETAAEVSGAVEASGQRPWARLQGLALPGPDFLAVHMTQLEDVEIQAVAGSGTHVIHCPESNLKLASGFCPVDKLIKAGINVALGTDGAASNNDLDMFGEMRSAALLAKGVAGDASALPAVQALQMATLNGAKAMGIDTQTGSLVAGKSADFISVDLTALGSQPVYHPISQLVYACQREQVRDVFVAGRALLRDGQYTDLDTAALRGKVQQWQERMQP